METDGFLSNTSDAEEEEVHSEKLATPLAPPHYFVKTEAELFWSFFRSRHRCMSGSSICLNMLLITVRLPIYLNVSIAVSHVPSAAPLSRLPHRQIIIYMSIFLPMNLISLTYSYEAYLRGLDTQYNVLQWLVEPAVRYVKCTDFVHDSNGLPHLQTATFLLMAL
ncbi:hypothetical protein T03_16645 [Trichinella britovi]|uniref:Uncharacterized protein n=1 Tax=Trichinella britovi TaxID=45882 RepID=A0A0V1CGT8_TRIBR|nr:hypothetical protein T03_16645 [Trichinella britovi]